MSESRAKKVRKANKDIREFYRIGRGIPAKQKHVDTYRQEAIDKEAKRLGARGVTINPDTLRKARQFAAEYTPEEVEELCQFIKDEQSDQGDKAPIFGKVHIIRLLTVPKRRRAALLRKAVKGAWSTRTLAAHIKLEFGTRREGGRDRQIAPDQKILLADLEGTCEQWRRWHHFLREEEEGRGGAHLLPDEINRQVNEIDRGIRRLREAVEQALAELHPGRQKREIKDE